MNYIIILQLLTHIIICHCDSTQERAKIKHKFIDQPIDHFEVNRTFKQRYIENARFWKQGGPVIIYVGGESHVEEWMVKQNAAVKLAKDTAGILFAIEHRYFGRSIPVINGTLPVRFQYLNTAQVIEDLKYFVEILKKKEEYANSKIVAVGVSYSGVLATWFKQKHPDLVDAVWASSAPVLAIMDFYQAYKYIGDLYKVNGGQACYEHIQNLFKYQSKFFENNCTLELKKENNICSYVKLNNKMAKWIYFHIYARHFYRVLQNLTIRKMCVRVRNFELAKKRFHSLGCKMYSFGKEKDKEERRKGMISYVQSVLASCNDLYENGCDPREFKLDLGSHAAWEWLTCSELGYFMTTSARDQPFGNNNPLEYFIKRCKVFGDEFTQQFIEERINQTNDQYGGVYPNVSKAVFVNGEYDYWNILSVKTSSFDNIVLTHKRGHGDDLLFFKRNKNISELKILRRTVIKAIKVWIR